MTIRALVLGFLGGLFIAGFGYINDRILQLESFNNGHQLAIIVVGTLFLSVVTINPLLHKFGEKVAFNAPELAVIFICLSISCSIPGRGLMEQFLQTLVMPFHWEKVTPGWKKGNLIDYAPEEMLVDRPTDTDDVVVSRFVSGTIDNKDEIAKLGPVELLKYRVNLVPWSKWRRPLTTWLPLIFLSAISSIALGLIVHKQWAHHELLSYPIADFVSSLIERKPDRSLPTVMLNSLFWIGFGIFFGIRLLNGANAWFPDQLVQIPYSFSFWSFSDMFPVIRRLPATWGPLTLRIFPLVIAFSFLLRSEISLTFGLSQILWILVAAPMVTMGVDLSNDYDIGGWSGWHGAGAYTALTLMIIYFGRHYYKQLLSRSVREWQRKVDGDSYDVWAFRIFVVSTIAMICLVIRLGLSWPIAIGTVLLMLMTFLVVARISAETGLFFIQPGWQPFGALLALMGAYSMSPTGIVIAGIICAVMCIDQSQSLLPYFINALRVGDRMKIKERTNAGLSMGLYVSGVILAIGLVLTVLYTMGTPQYGYANHRVPTMAFRAAQTEALNLRGKDRLEDSERLSGIERIKNIKPKPLFLWAAGSGFFLVLLFAFLRLRFTWWPLHPLLFLVWTTYPIGVMFHSFLIGWIVKKIVLRYGGNRLVQKLKPLMFGVIAGEVMGAVFFMVVGAIYYFWTGEKPTSYRFFPR